MKAITLETLFEEVRKNNHLRGRQKIITYWRDGDEWVFDSNAKGGYGETLTFHYRNTKHLLAELGYKEEEENSIIFIA